MYTAFHFILEDMYICQSCTELKEIKKVRGEYQVLMLSTLMDVDNWFHYDYGDYI